MAASVHRFELRLLASGFDKVAAKRFVGSGVKAPAGIALDDIEAAFAEYGKLIAKPIFDGSSYGLMLVQREAGHYRVRRPRDRKPI